MFFLRNFFFLEKKENKGTKEKKGKLNQRSCPETNGPGMVPHQNEALVIGRTQITVCLSEGTLRHHGAIRATWYESGGSRWLHTWGGGVPSQGERRDLEDAPTPHKSNERGDSIPPQKFIFEMGGVGSLEGDAKAPVV